MRVYRRRVRCLTVLGGLAALAVAGQAPLDAQSQVVVRAVSSDGQPVLDLKADDLTVRTDGRTREVKTLELVRPSPAAAAIPPAPPAPPASALPPPFATNAAATAGPKGGREFLIAIDDEGIGPGREEPVRDAIAKLVATMAPADLVGLVTMKQGGLSIAPTRDHASVLASLPKVSTTGSSRESAMDLACRTKVMLNSIAGFLSTAPPERTIVFFSAGMAPSNESVQNRLAAESGLCLIRTSDLEDLGRAAAGSPAELFVIYHTEGLANTANQTSGQAGLENLAGTTGGEFIRMSGRPDAVVTRISRTAGIYYLATLDEGGAATARRIDARVNRDNVRVVARPVAPVAAAGPAAKAGSPKEMIRVPDVFRAVAIRAAGFVSRQQGAQDLKVVALFEPEDASTQLSAAMVGLFDEKGSLKAQWTAQPAELERSPVIAALTAAPGKYRMRVAAADASGQGGTTDYDLDVQLPDAPPVKISHMLLGVGQGGFAPRLAFTSADAAAIGLLEIYGVSKDTKVETTFEIVKADGEVMGSGQGTVGAGAGDDARIAYGGFGIATLEPGDYTMRATINVDGKQAGVVTRTLRKLK
jgi:VWFA-related protein